MLDYVLLKAIRGVDPHFIDVWVPMHRDDPEATQKLVSNNFNTFVCIVCFICVSNNFTFVQNRYTEELRKTHGPDTDLRSVPFDVNVVYHAGGGLSYGMYVECH
jgi:hypothetical protein